MKGIMSFSLLLSLLSATCKPSLAEKFIDVNVRNNSAGSVKAFLVIDAGSRGLYPDTTLPDSSFNGLATIRPGKTGMIFDGGTRYRNWNAVFEKLRSDTLSVYVLDSATLASRPWAEIKAQYNILQRYDVSYRDLDARNFTLEYPYDPTRGTLKTWQP